MNLELMRLIDQEYTVRPFYGSRRLQACLRRQGYEVNRKRICRLMGDLGLQAIYPKKKLSIAAKEHERFPYLLKDTEIRRPDQVWSADITYIRLLRGFVYLVAIMDWYSRYVVSWEVSITLEKEFCLNALGRALKFGKPEIFNTDQGAQFTSPSFLGLLKAAQIKISMDGRGRAFDNIFIERLWRSVKWEQIYLHEYREVIEPAEGLREYFGFYNVERPHQALNYRTPAEVHYEGRKSSRGRIDRRVS